jgi:hypothetical protein
VALLEKRRFLNNHSGDFPQVILILSQSRAEQVLCHLTFLYVAETAYSSFIYLFNADTVIRYFPVT